MTRTPQHPGMLGRMQRGLESMYRVETGASVEDYVIDAASRDAASPTRRPREQLLVCEDAGDMELGLFVDPAAVANLVANDPSRGLSARNFGDFLLAIEGVSHFVYMICCARVERRVSQLELELQAEVDKYVTCLLVSSPARDVSAALRNRLFAECEYEPDLDAEERDRYRAANDNAQRYAAYLETAFVGPQRIPEMLDELRRFYRASLATKLSHIARASVAA